MKSTNNEQNTPKRFTKKVEECKPSETHHYFDLTLSSLNFAVDTLRLHIIVKTMFMLNALLVNTEKSAWTQK
jgi:hypothetical protein